MALTVRPATVADRQDLFRICLLTANSGADATALYSDPDYPGLVWAVPYLEFEPNHAFVVADEKHVVGYILGTPDTAAYEARLDRDWWPVLRERYAGRQSKAKSDPAVLGRIAEPEHSDPSILTKYPAHLHINLLPPAQSGGWGRKLVETELASLKAAGASGVHLGVSLTNERAIGFYRHLGFAELARGQAVWMGREL